MELKEVLHLYIGCNCLADNINFKLHGVEYTDTGTLAYDGTMINEIHQCWWVENCDFKPILRPLSDMTEEEKGHFIKICELEPEDIGCVEQLPTDIFPGGMGTAHLTNIFQWATGVRYLTSKGFDIYDLIPSGQAIDKTTIQQ